MQDEIWPNRLRELRQYKIHPHGRPTHLSDVASYLGCTISYLSKLERGRQRPDDSVIEALANYYSVPASEIATGTPHVEIDELKLIGAWIRVRRKGRRISIEALAKELEVSPSLIRLVEVGQREFQQEDRLSNDLAHFFQMASVGELTRTALAAADQPDVRSELSLLHPTAVAQSSPRAITLTKGTPVTVPPDVERHLEPGLQAIMVEEAPEGHPSDADALCAPLPPGTFLITRAGAMPLNGLVVAGARLFNVRNNVFKDVEGTVVSRPPDARPVTAIIFPTDIV